MKNIYTRCGSFFAAVSSAARENKTSCLARTSPRARPREKTNSKRLGTSVLTFAKSRPAGSKGSRLRLLFARALPRLARVLARVPLLPLLPAVLLQPLQRWQPQGTQQLLPMVPYHRWRLPPPALLLPLPSPMLVPLQRWQPQGTQQLLLMVPYHRWRLPPPALLLPLPSPLLVPLPSPFRLLPTRYRMAIR
jgi:hypothetical protein